MQNKDEKQEKKDYGIVDFFVNLYNKWNKSNRLKKMSVESLRDFHENLDPNENKKTKIPIDEQVRQNCLWLSEIYPPESINKLISNLDNLGWTDSSSKKLSEIIKDIRENSHSRWHNLGYIVPPNTESLLPNKESILPFGVKHVKLSLIQPFSSTTILIFQFIFNDTASKRIEEPINKKYTTYSEKIKNGNRYITPINQKIASLAQLKQSIFKECVNWIEINLPGYYTSNKFTHKMPIFEFITLNKATPFPNTPGLPDNYLHVLNLNFSSNVWISDDLDGLYFRLSRPKDQQSPNLQLIGKTSEIFRNKDITAFGSNNINGYVNVLNFFDQTIAIFSLFHLYKTYEWQVSIIRDKISNINISNIKEATSLLNDINKNFAILDRNLPFFAFEVRKFCENQKLFLLNIYTFHKMQEDSHNIELINEIRITLFNNSKSLLTTHDNLRQSIATTSSIINSISNEKLSKTNFALQIIMIILSIIMLILTCKTIFVKPVKSYPTIIQYLHYLPIYEL